MFNRFIDLVFKRQMQAYPVVTLTGPRQSGKTTFVKTAYPDRPYYNLENPDTRTFIETDSRLFFNKLNLETGVIFDEIQRAPELLSYVQTYVDEKRIPGSFILTSSHQLQLSQAVSQSLAGRTALLELLPLSLDELKTQNIILTTDDYLFRGFFPAIYQHALEPNFYARNYIKTYLERDVRQITNIQDLHAFQHFITLCAGRIGSTINRESLSNEVGVSQSTIKNWLSLLEASYLTYELRPYHENFGKRATKSPKLYFLDVGLISYLLGIKTVIELSHEKLRGALFENMVIIEFLKYFSNRGEDANIYFFRDSHHNEIDIILKTHDQLIPIEIKSTATFHPALLKNLHYFQKLVGKRAPKGFLIYAGELEQRFGDIQILNYKNWQEMFGENHS